MRSILSPALLVCAAHIFAADGNHLTYLDSADPSIHRSTREQTGQ